MKIIDIHAHYGKWFFPIFKTSIPCILEILRKNNIQKAIMCSSKALFYSPEEGNRELACAVKKAKELYAYLFLNPNYVELARRDIKRYLRMDKFVGVGELYSGEVIGAPFDCDGHRRIFEFLQDNYPEKPVLCHADPSHVSNVARDFPGLTFIIAHCYDWNNAVLAARRCSNIYLEICAQQPRSKLEDLVRGVGAERVLFGSDLSLLPPEKTLGMIMDSEISDLEKEAILYRNALRLFKFAQ